MQNKYYCIIFMDALNVKTIFSANVCPGRAAIYILYFDNFKYFV